MENILAFIHGLESTARGTKGQYFHEYFPQMIIEDFSGNFIKRMRKLNNTLNGKNNLIIVGSSFGGTMAVQYAAENEKKMKKLILLAPALNLPELNLKPKQHLDIPVIVYHGTQDDVVDHYLVKDIAQKIFIKLEHHLVDDDHSLHKTFYLLDWYKLLRME